MDFFKKRIIEPKTIPGLDTYDTKYGKISLYKNELNISQPFKKGGYWDIDTLLKLKSYIDPNKNILEIGGHCGTSSIVYSSFLKDTSKIFVYEPQKKMFELLEHNIKQNGLENRIQPYNKAVFCFSGKGNMNDIDLDGGGGKVKNRYTIESDLPCNFGGICLGKDGEEIETIMIDHMEHDNIGFIHCDAQGAENFIFSKGINLIKKYRPVIFFENNMESKGFYLYQKVAESYPEYRQYANFNLIDFCIKELGYSRVIKNFNSSIDDLLIP